MDKPTNTPVLVFGQSRRRRPGMLHRVPRGLQQQPMLRVHQPDLARRHAEERRVESGHVVDEAGTTRHDLAGRVGIRVEEFVDIPAVLRHLRHRVAALAQHVPEPVGVLGARETRCVADDGKTRCRLDRMFGGSHAVVLLCVGDRNVLPVGHHRAPEEQLSRRTLWHLRVWHAGVSFRVRTTPGDRGRSGGMLIPHG